MINSAWKFIGWMIVVCIAMSIGWMIWMSLPIESAWGFVARVLASITIIMVIHYGNPNRDAFRNVEAAYEYWRARK